MNINEGLINYGILIEAGEYAEAQEFAEDKVALFEKAADAWRELANAAQFQKTRVALEKP